MVFNVRSIFSYFNSTLCILNVYMSNARKGVFSIKLAIYNHIYHSNAMVCILMLKHDIKIIFVESVSKKIRSVILRYKALVDHILFIGQFIYSKAEYNVNK